MQFALREPVVGGRPTLKTEVLQTIGRTLDFAGHYGANLDALFDALVDMGDAQRIDGVVILLDRIPVGPGFDADARESLLETFRDAADRLADQRQALQGLLLVRVTGRWRGTLRAATSQRHGLP